MPRLRTSLVALASVAVSALSASSAAAGGVNDWGCRPSPNRPPVILVHGQSGNFEGLGAITGALNSDGYCVFAINHGFMQGGTFGQEHLTISADQIAGLVNDVLARTGASKVNLVGHSAGTGVIDSFILTKGGWSKVNRVVSFGGLHHPYTHLADSSVYLPNITLLAQQIVPGITIQDIVKIGADLGLLSGPMLATAASNFVADLFDPVYWKNMFGKLEEKPSNIVMIGQTKRTYETADSAPSVCYTNIVAPGDMLVGPATGFLNPGPNIENVTVTVNSANAHSDMVGTPEALGKMMEGFNKPCTPAPSNSNTLRGNMEVGDGTPDPSYTAAFEDALRQRSRPIEYESAGCSAAPTSSAPSASLFGAFAFATAIAGAARRSIRRARERLSSTK